MAPEFLDLHYKAHPYCDHVAKFHGDRPRELGDRVAKKIKKKKKHHGTNVPGGLISRPSVCSSVRNAEVPWAYRLDKFEINYTKY